MNVLDLKERIAISDQFTPEERTFLLEAVNARAGLLKREDERTRLVRERRAAGASINTIAAELGVTKQAIQHRLQKLERPTHWSDRFPAYFRTALVYALERDANDLFKLSEQEVAELAARRPMSYYVRVPLMGRKALTILQTWLLELGLQPAPDGAVQKLNQINPSL